MKGVEEVRSPSSVSGMWASYNVISIFIRVLAQWTFSGSGLVIPVYSMIGGENIMYKFGVVRFLFEISLNGLSMSCPVDSGCGFFCPGILVPHMFHQC